MTNERTSARAARFTFSGLFELIPEPKAQLELPLNPPLLLKLRAPRVQSGDQIRSPLPLAA